MSRKTMLVAALALVAAGAAVATPIGNPLIARTSATDGASNVLEVYTASPVPADGMIDVARIYKQNADSRDFSAFVLRPTSTPGQYDVVAQAGPIHTYGTQNAINAYACPLPVQAGDLFAHTQRGIPYDNTGTEPLYYPLDFGNPQVGTTISLPSTQFPYYTNRTYSLQMNVDPAKQLVGNDLVSRASGSDGAAYVFNVYWDSPMPTGGLLTDVHLYKQANYPADYNFHVYVLRATGNTDEYDVLYDSGIMSPVGQTGQVQTYPLPGGPIEVQVGDLLAHYGRGIPYAQGSGETLFYPVDPPPGAGDTITLYTSDFPAYSQPRTYSLAVTLTPEPTTLALLALGGGLLVRRRRRRHNP